MKKNLKKNLNLKKYHDYDDIECRQMRDVKDLFNLSIDEDYCKPVITNDLFNSNYIEYESKGDKNKTLLIKEYLNVIRPYLKGIIKDYKTQGEWKIQLIMVVTFISSIDFNENRTMHTKSNNIEIMMGNEADEIIEELFESLSEKYEERLEEKMRGGKFSLIVLIYCIMLISVDLFSVDNFHKISSNKDGAYIDSPKWLKNTTATINP